MRFAFIAGHRDVWPVRIQCRVLAVSSSGFYAWAYRSASRRERHNAGLLQQIRQVHVASRGLYGSPRIHAQLRRGTLHHSDRGGQCVSHAFRALLHRHGLRSSMGRPGNCYDNAVAASFFASLKRELAQPRVPRNAGR